MQIITRYLSRTLLMIVAFAILPLVTLANGDDIHPPGEERLPVEEAGGLSPIVGLIGLVLVVGVGFGVWVFMQQRGGAAKPPQVTEKESVQGKKGD